MSDIVGTVENDILVGTAGADNMDGGDGNDRLNGGDGDDVVSGGDGRDYVYGDAGDDTLYGGLGDDALVGDAGNDLIYGGDGNDGVFGGGLNDIIYGEAGTDTIFGDGGNDTVDGGADNDKIYGGSGNDALFGGTGDDFVDGGSGNDTLIYQFGTGSDTMAGGTGIDTLELVISEADLASVSDELSDFADWLDAQYEAAGGIDAMARAASTEAFTFQSMGLTVSSVEKLRVIVDGREVPFESLFNSAPELDAVQAVATAEDVALSGTVGAHDPDGDALTHLVSSGPAHGTVTIDAASGEFVYIPANNYSGQDSFEVTVTDAKGATSVQRVDVSVEAVADAPELNVSDAAYVTGNTIIEGTSDPDILVGTANSDLIIGGDSNDIIYSEDPSGATYTVALDIEAALGDLDGSETLTIQISGLPEDAFLSAGTEISAGVWEVAPANLATLSLHTDTATDATLTVSAIAAEANGSTSSVTATIAITFDEVAAGGGEDILRGGGGDDLMFGGDGFDYVDYSTTGNGVVVSLVSGIGLGDGYDTFTGIEGVIGSDFSDRLIGDGQDNVFLDGGGRDQVHAGGGDDLIIAAADTSNDKYDGDGGFDVVDYSAVNGSIVADLQNGNVKGASGHDLLFGIESVIGGAGDDVLKGSRNDDVLNGGAGNDELRGARGNDTLTGGEGNDTFVFVANDVISGSNYFGYDTITDFGPGDILDFSGLASGKSPIDVDRDIEIRDSLDGTFISVDLGGQTGFVDIVLLEDVHGLELNDLIVDGHVVV